MIKLQIAVDGPASSGKSTVAKIVAQNLGIIYLDTGAMYRAATLVALQNKTEDPEKIIDVIKKKPIFFKNTADGQLVFLGTEDITKIIRTNEVTQNVSKISALSAVREFLVAEQQRIASEGVSSLSSS